VGFLSCVWVSVSGVLFSVGVCVCGLLTFLHYPPPPGTVPRRRARLQLRGRRRLLGLAGKEPLFRVVVKGRLGPTWNQGRCVFT